MAASREERPRCILCGTEMREELGMERSHEDITQRWWTCPNCLHRQTTIDGDGGNRRPGEGRQQCTSM
jgi:DNA-directed RNA polymerase subunit RPC12/RpoP